MRGWIALTTVLCLGACDKPSEAPAPTSPADVAASEPAEEPTPTEAPTDDPSPDQPAEEEPATDDDGGLGPAAATTAGDPVDVPKDPAEGLTEPTSFASIKLEIRTPDGKVYRDSAKVIRWEQSTRIPIDFEGERHEFLLDVRRSGKQATVEMTYLRGGTEILRKYALDTKIKKRELLRIDDGTALAVTVTPKTIKPKPASQQKIDNPEGNDPLTGVDAKKKK